MQFTAAMSNDSSFKSDEGERAFVVPSGNRSSEINSINNL
jgi:hypothetical protein